MHGSGCVGYIILVNKVFKLDKVLLLMELKKISENEWEIPKSGGMKVPAKIFASEKLIQKIKQDRTLMQAANVAHLKGIQKFSFVMPDAHEGLVPSTC